MTLLERIRKAGGFLDCGMILSMPLGYFMDGSIATTDEYWDVRKLAAAKKIHIVGKATNKEFKRYLTLHLKEGDLYQVK